MKLFINKYVWGVVIPIKDGIRKCIDNNIISKSIRTNMKLNIKRKFGAPKYIKES